MEKMFEKQVAKGLEGIMAKKLDGTYQAGARGWNWIKLKGSYTEKLADTVDAVVMGIDFGKGKRSDFGVGAFLIGVFDPDTSTYKTISKVGTGLTDEEWRELKTKSEKLKSENKPTEYDTNKIMDCDVWIKPELVGEFKADELTKSPMHTAGFALRFPRLVRWREKKPEDSTSLKEISQLAKLQKKG
jgi:DNA ligase-1